MMVPRLAPDDAAMVLAMGVASVRARLEHQERVGDSREARPHPIPDLTGQATEVIAEAVFSAIALAHDPSQGVGSWDNAPCDSCRSLIDLASHYGDPTHMEWPDPVRRCLADVLDAELERRGEPPAWMAARSGVGGAR
jgi:hypothetical protein